MFLFSFEDYHISSYYLCVRKMAIYNKESHIFIKGGHVFYKNESGICFEPEKGCFS